MVFGISSTLVGVGILVWPRETVHVVALVFAAALLAASLLRFLAAFAFPEGTLDRPIPWAALAGAGLIVGVYLLLDWAISLVALMILVSIYLFAHGIVELVQVERSDLWIDRAWVLASGTIALVVALIWTTSMIVPASSPLPHESLVLLRSLLGSWLILYGLLLILRGARGIAGARRST
jgi:uncharacterized membrane protein HdeD (DUF308 family)